MDTEVLDPDRQREAVASEDANDESSPPREEVMTDVVGQLRAIKMKAAPADPTTDAARQKVAATEESRATLAELIELSEKMRQGDRRAQERIVWILDNNPALADLLGDLSQRAETALIEAVSGDVFAFKLARARRVDAMRRQLLTEHSTPLERLAVENVIMSRLQMQFVDLQFASAVERGGPLGEWSKVLERVAKRFQSSVKTLQLASAVSRLLNRSNSPVAATPSVAAATKAKAGKRTRSKPAKGKSKATSTDKPPSECNEQQNCETPVRPRAGVNRTTRKPANRIASYGGTNGASPNSNGHAIPEPVVGVLDGK